MNVELIKYLRSITDLSQSELASKVGVHQSLISKIEKGIVPAQPETEFKIMQVFSDAGISTQDIVLLQGVFNNRRIKGV
ncbi:helix-turn-helix protein [Cytobacillus oceanisediminis]|uniref:Helix-turn-helix protein n=1 Tax=Cytobacillus oceanisediminis TaxID=665099 RepID=A0A2V2ZJW6_9BACI|nr:helix-turn-helix transcriptional regulator [Cytobacillus oceanisediminis]PWW20223.1 helix-turn-helix protein [Cytobacillus oceanisediminis]